MSPRLPALLLQPLQIILHALYHMGDPPDRKASLTPTWGIRYV